MSGRKSKEMRRILLGSEKKYKDLSGKEKRVYKKMKKHYNRTENHLKCRFMEFLDESVNGDEARHIKEKRIKNKRCSEPMYTENPSVGV
jgi:hypothetical protein